jgi:antitoxin component YwqK of YwqJK toxin-antitoxin module
MLKRVNEIYTEWENSNYLLYEGELFTGVEYCVYPDGKLQKERSYYEGIEAGFDRYWHSNGVLGSDTPKRGPCSIAITFSREWHSNQQLKEECTMEHNVLIARKIWNEEGILVRDWTLEEDESEPIYRLLQSCRADNHEYPPAFLEFEVEVEKYLAKYPSDRVYYEKDFL